MELGAEEMVFGGFAVGLLSWVEELIDERHRCFAENVERGGHGRSPLLEIQISETR